MTTLSFSSFFPYLIVMAGVTYLIRMLPMTVFRKPIHSRFIKSFLYYVPYAVLASMTFPDVLTSTGNLWTALAGLVVALVLAWKEKSMVVVAVGACLTVAAAQTVMIFL